jgi:ribonuclease HI
MKNGWRNSQKKPVANVDLWQPFVELYLSRQGEITYEWVKGHSGDTMNDLVDRLAVAASAGPYEEAVEPAAPPATLF